MSTVPGKRGWQNPGRVVCTPPWPPWCPSCHCTLCPTPESRSSPPAPPHVPRTDFGLHLTGAEDRQADRCVLQLYAKLYYFCVCTTEKVAHSAVETHGGNVAAYCCIFFVAAAQRVTVEVALSQWLFKPGALHLVHVHRSNPCRQTQQGRNEMKRIFHRLLLCNVCNILFRFCKAA